MNRLDQYLQDHPETASMNILARDRHWVGFGRKKIEQVMISSTPLHALEQGHWVPIQPKPALGPEGELRGEGMLPRSVGVLGNRYRRLHMIGKPFVHKSSIIRSAGPYLFETLLSPDGHRDFLTLPSFPGSGIAIEYLGGLKNCGASLPYAEDALGNQILCDLEKRNGRFFVSVPRAWLEKAVYPVLVDPAVTICQTCFNLGSDSTYAGARNTAGSAGQCGGPTAASLVGQALVSATYTVYRLSVRFNLQGLRGTITDVTLDLAIKTDNSTDDFDVEIAKSEWYTAGPGAGACTSQSEFIYDTCLAAALDVVWRNTSGISVDTVYTSPSMSTTYAQGRMDTYGWIDYCMRSAEDSGNSAPTDLESVQMYCCGAMNYAPVLTLTGTFFQVGGSYGTIVP